MRAGLTFKGISSTELGLTMRTNSRMVIPQINRSSIAMLHRPGSVDFGIDTYAEGEISVTFTWLCTSPSEAMAKAETISGWLHNDGNYHELMFNDYPNRKYYAKVTSAVPLQKGPCKGTITVTFTVNPPYAFALDNTPIDPQAVQDMLLWDTAYLAGNQYTQTLTANGAIRFTLSGNHSDKPIIKLIGHISPGLTLSYKTQQWQYTALLPYDGIRINCKNETVRRISDNANLFQHVNPQRSAFFEITPGKNQINVVGVSDFLTVIIELNPAY